MTVAEQPDARVLGRRLFVFLLLVFGLCAHGYVDNFDAEVEFQTARGLWLRGAAGLSEGHADASAAERGIVTFRHQDGTVGFDVKRGNDGEYYSWFGIGHAWTMVPFYALGRGLARVFPDAEATALRTKDADVPGGLGRALGEEFWAHLAVSFHSPLFAAGIGWVLFLILGHLGIAVRTRVVAVLLATLTTQLLPGSRESMADTTAGFFLLATVERALAWRFGRGARVLAVAGMLAGCAVLCRNFHALPVLAVCGYVLHHARAGGRWRDVVWLAAAGLPFALASGWFNHARFGSVFDFGYGPGTKEGYWSFPFFWGFLLLALSPGKGAFLFSPLLWLAPRGWLAARGYGPEVLLFGAILVLPWLLSSFTTGWHSSQAWACRYMTVGPVLAIATGVGWLGERLPELRLWQRTALVLAGLGFLVNLGGVLTPYRGFYDLGTRAWAERWPASREAGGDAFQNACVDPRQSPLHGHWVYAWLTLGGDIPSDESRPYATLYGTVPRAPDGQALPARPTHGEDSRFRHLWPIGLRWRLDSSLPLLLGALLAAGVVVAGVRLRRGLG